MSTIIDRKGKFLVRWKDGEGHRRGRLFVERLAAEAFLAEHDDRRPSKIKLPPKSRRVHPSAIVTPIACVAKPPASPHQPSAESDPRWWHRASRMIADELLQAVQTHDEVSLARASKAARAFSSLITANRRFLDDEELREALTRTRAKMKEVQTYRKDHI